MNTNMKRLSASLRGAFGLVAVGGILASLPVPAQACSYEPFLGTICIVTYSRGCPRGYLPADGRSIQITQNQALFSLLGFTFGGDGQTSFKLPNLNGRTPVGVGPATQINQYPPTSQVVMGEIRGAESRTLTEAQLPPHVHAATFTPTTGPISVTIPAQAGSGAITATATTDVVPGSSGVDPAPNVSNYHLTGVSTGAAGPVTTTAPGVDKSTLVGTHVIVDASNYKPSIPQQTVSITTVTGGKVTVDTNTTTNLPVSTLPPQLGLLHCIATEGTYPNFN